MVNQMVYINIVISIYLIIGIILAVREQKELKDLLESGDLGIDDLSMEKNVLNEMRVMLEDVTIQNHPKLEDYRRKFKQLEDRVQEVELKRNRLRIRNLRLVEKLRNQERALGDKFWRSLFLKRAFLWFPQGIQDYYRRMKN